MARPPSKRAHDQVLAASLTLFAKSGIESTSMDAIAEASGVSKATIYKHWPSKNALCLELMERLHQSTQPSPVPAAGDVRENIVALLAERSAKKRTRMQSRMMPHLLAYAARNLAFGKVWRARVLEPPRAALTVLLKRAVTEGRLAAHLDLDLAVAQLIGPTMYCRILEINHVASPPNAAQRVVDSFWLAHGTTHPKDAQR